MLVIEKPLMGLKTSSRAPWAFLRVARCFSAVSDAHVTPAFRNGLNFAANFKARDFRSQVLGVRGGPLAQEWVSPICYLFKLEVENSRELV